MSKLKGFFVVLLMVGCGQPAQEEHSRHEPEAVAAIKPRPTPLEAEKGSPPSVLTIEKREGEAPAEPQA